MGCKAPCDPSAGAERVADPALPADLARAAASVGASAGEGRPLPPVHLWNPAHCGEIDIRILRDGSWLHEGAPIRRPELVRLFSTVLRRDPDGFHLVTPAEKLKIVVEDAPFVAVRVDREGDALRFLTNVGDVTEAGPEHRLWVEIDPRTGEPTPYVHVRAGLNAKLSRPVFYEVVNMARVRKGVLGVSSNQVWFPFGPAGAA